MIPLYYSNIYRAYLYSVCGCYVPLLLVQTWIWRSLISPTFLFFTFLYIENEIQIHCPAFPFQSLHVAIFIYTRTMNFTFIIDCFKVVGACGTASTNSVGIVWVAVHSSLSVLMARWQNMLDQKVAYQCPY